MKQWILVFQMNWAIYLWNSAAVAAAVVIGVLGAVAAADVDPFDFDGDPAKQKELFWLLPFLVDYLLESWVQNAQKM